MKTINNCIYRFLNKDNEIIYIGKAGNLISRMNNHNHLPKECYDETVYIEYTEFETEDEMDLAERYYIPKYKPKYNIVMRDRVINFTLSELENRIWSIFKKEDYVNTEYNNKKSVRELITDEYYETMLDAQIKTGISSGAISGCCNNRIRRVFNNNREIRCFVFEEDYKNMSKKDIEYKIKMSKVDRVVNEVVKEPSIICLETDKLYIDLENILKEYPTISKGRLYKNLKYKEEYVWEGTFNLKKLRFMYLKDYNNPQNLLNKILLEEVDKKTEKYILEIFDIINTKEAK